MLWRYVESGVNTGYPQPWLIERTRRFLDSLGERSFEPRRWVEQHASLEANRAAWSMVIDELGRMDWTPARGL